MVVLIVAGVGTNYLCTAPNVWSQVAGGSGSPPGGTTGDIQFNSGVGVFGGNVAEVNAVAFAGADICAQVTAAIAALPADGGTVLVPGGNWPACAGSGGIGITINKHVILKGVGSATPSASASGPTTINFAAGVTGIDISGASDKASVRDLYLLSASAGAGTDDGIRVRSGSVTLQNVSVKHFGRYGINVDGGNTGGSADLWHFEDVEAGNNFSDGFHWSSPCTDNNLGTGIQLNAFVNGGWGYRIACGPGNQFLTTHATQNVLGGIFVGSSNERFDNTYIETGVGSSFVIDAGLTDVNVSFHDFGQPTTITNPTPTNSANRIQYVGVDSYPVQNGLFLGSEFGEPNNKTYMMRVDGSNGELNLFNYSNVEFLFHWDPTTKWLFNSRVMTTSSATLPGLNVGVIPGDPSTLTNGDMWYDTVSNRFRCYENGGSTDCIGGGGSVTHTLGPLTAGNCVIGNGAADVKVDPNCNTDAVGNVVAVSFQTSGVNGGFTGVEGDGSGLTGGSGVDLFYPDSTGHCWHQNLNNVDSGCTPASLGANNFRDSTSTASSVNSKVNGFSVTALDGASALEAAAGRSQLDVAASFTSTTLTPQYALSAGASIVPTGNATILTGGILGGAFVPASNTHDISFISGTETNVVNASASGTTGIQAGIQAVAYSKTGGTVSANLGVDGEAFTTAGTSTVQRGGVFIAGGSGGTITNNYGVYIDNDTAGGATFTHNYGLYVKDQSPGGGSNPDSHSIFVAGSSPNDLGSGVTTIGKYASNTNCAAVGSAANPSVAACSAAAAGSFSCATAASTGTCQVNTTAVTANSEIFVTQRADTTTGTRLSVTCNTGVTTVTPVVTAVSAGASFTINLGTIAVSPECFSYFIVN